jgi:hypothetical protein
LGFITGSSEMAGGGSDRSCLPQVLILGFGVWGSGLSGLGFGWLGFGAWGSGPEPLVLDVGPRVEGVWFGVVKFGVFQT